MAWDEPAYPDATYLIVSVFPETIREIKGFRWNPQEKKFTEVPVETKEKINLNTASVEELVKLKGVGSKIAARIIEHREKHGLFTSVADLIKVKGIGKKRLEQNEGKLYISSDCGSFPNDSSCQLTHRS
jgi:competence ComEA-like helix-hairpin-helix protein